MANRIIMLNEYESEKIIKNYLKIPKSKVLNLNEIKSLDFFPAYLKILSTNISHKAKKGGIFYIKDKKDLLNKIKEIEETCKKLKVDSLLAQEEIKEGEEFIIGIKKDKKFGYVIMLGIGGSKAEIINDVTFRLIPITKKDAEEMLNELRNNAIVERINKKALIDALLNIQNMTKKYNIEFVDLNPIKVGKKAIVVDAKVFIKEGNHG